MSINAVVPYVFPPTNQAVRTVIRDGEPWFCLQDVCDCLNVNNIGTVAARLREVSNPTVNQVVSNNTNNTGVILLDVPTNKGVHSLTFVSEPNLYRVIFTSRKQEAVVFQNWVFEDVLPSIRKTGHYSVNTIVQSLPEPPPIRKVTALDMVTMIPLLEHLAVTDPRMYQVVRDKVYNELKHDAIEYNTPNMMGVVEIAQMLGYSSHLINDNASQLGRYVSKRISNDSPKKKKELKMYKGSLRPTYIYLADDEVKTVVKEYMDALKCVAITHDDAADIADIADLD